jgi:hypothetical protein
MLRTRASTPIANLIWLMVQHTDWRSRHSANKDIALKTALRCFKHWSIPSARTTDIQIFLRAHNERNLAEYEGRIEIDEDLLADLIRCTKRLEAAVGKLAPPTAE